LPDWRVFSFGIISATTRNSSRSEISWSPKT
jgi:hypothetical protein